MTKTLRKTNNKRIIENANNKLKGQTMNYENHQSVSKSGYEKSASTYSQNLAPQESTNMLDTPQIIESGDDYVDVQYGSGGDAITTRVVLLA